MYQNQRWYCDEQTLLAVPIKLVHPKLLRYEKSMNDPVIRPRLSCWSQISSLPSVIMPAQTKTEAMRLISPDLSVAEMSLLSRNAQEISVNHLIPGKNIP
jgi:hypothetical protein